MNNFIIYNPDFSNFHEISDVISIKYNVFYNEIGKISIVLPLTPELAKNTYANCLVYDVTRDLAFWIMQKNINTQKAEIRLNGYTATYLLKKCVVVNGRPYNEYNAEKTTYDLVVKNKHGMDIVAAPLKGLEGQVFGFLVGGNLSDRVVEIIQDFGWGHMMHWDAEKKTFIFEMFKGRDLTQGEKAVVFSPERGTANNLIINEDWTVLKNQYWIRGEYQDAKGGVSSVYRNINTDKEAEKYQLQAMWINEEPTKTVGDAYSPTGDEGGTFRNYLYNRLNQEAAKPRTKRESFTVDVSGEGFKTLYNLGDLVTCSSITYGINFNKTVNGFCYQADARGEKTSLILGEPAVNIADVIKYN